MKKSNRGGKRKGAGRPPSEPEFRQKVVSFRLAQPEIIALGVCSRFRGFSKNTLIRKLIQAEAVRVENEPSFGF